MSKWIAFERKLIALEHVTAVTEDKSYSTKRGHQTFAVVHTVDGKEHALTKTSLDTVMATLSKILQGTWEDRDEST